MAEESAAPAAKAPPAPKEKEKKIPSLDLRSDKAQGQIKKQDEAEQPEEEEEPEEPATPAPPATSGGGGSGLDLWNPSPMQNLVLGAGLIALNFFTQTDLGTLLGRIWTAPKTAADVATKTKFSAGSLWTLGGEGVFVLVLSFLTGLSPALARGITLFYLALYLVWLVFNGQKLSGFGNLLQGITPPSSTTQQLNNSGGGTSK